jgi:hypothetical protein
LTEGQQTKPPRGHHKTGGVIDLPGNPQPCFAEGTTLGEQAELGMAIGEKGPRVHGGQGDRTEVFMAPYPAEGCLGLPKAGDRPPILALVEVGSPKPLVRERLQDDLSAGRGEHKGTPGRGAGLVIEPSAAEIE